jgi:hypothetical protein
VPKQDLRPDSTAAGQVDDQSVVYPGVPKVAQQARRGVLGKGAEARVMDIEVISGP